MSKSCTNKEEDMKVLLVIIAVQIVLSAISTIAFYKNEKATTFKAVFYSLIFGMVLEIPFLILSLFFLFRFRFGKGSRSFWFT